VYAVACADAYIDTCPQPTMPVVPVHFSRVTVNSSHGQLVTRSTRHKEAVNSSQANKQANIKAVLPQQYNYPYP